MVSQSLLARGIDISLIETDVEMIQAAANFGFKVYYGDGTRLDVLRTSGAGRAEAILICVDKAETANHIVQLANAEFPLAKLYVRAYDRTHTLHLLKEGVEYEIRETLESAMALGEQALIGLGVPPDEAREVTEDARRRDNERLEFLGDSVLGFLTADMLFRRFPDLPEGDLTRLRAALVRTESFAGLAQRCRIGEALRMGKGEEASGGRERITNLCGAFEAFMGALYLDKGLEAVRAVIGFYAG